MSRLHSPLRLIGSADHVGGGVRFNDDGTTFYVVVADERVPAPSVA